MFQGCKVFKISRFQGFKVSIFQCCNVAMLQVPMFQCFRAVEVCFAAATKECQERMARMTERSRNSLAPTASLKHADSCVGVRGERANSSRHQPAPNLTMVSELLAMVLFTSKTQLPQLPGCIMNTNLFVEKSHKSKPEVSSQNLPMKSALRSDEK
jgi:hypothetical protein